ncbi:MAG: diaminopimelate decarboxylase, partial [Bacteroidota bacterium]
MQATISRYRVSELFQQALQVGLIREEDTAILFHDLDYLASRIAYLKSCFPATTLHGLAIKSNPLLRILEFTRKLGTGVEAATTGELTLALKAGYLPHQIVFDSPVKTVADLRFALEQGVHVNCDNLMELNRVDILLKDIQSASNIGIRINPQVGVGSILESSVAGEYSKFGVPIKSRRKELEDAFSNYSWLTGIHLHVGSQGCAMELLVEGVGILYDFTQDINEKRKARSEQPIDIFDIGGG